MMSASSPINPPVSSFHPVSIDLHSSSAQSLLAALSSSPHDFLQPPPSLHAAAIVLAKSYLDPLATSTSEAHAKRLQNVRKRKRVDPDGLTTQTVLRLKQVHTEGFEITQIWEQARRVLDASRKEVERCLPDLLTEKNNEVTATDPALLRPDEKSGDQLISQENDKVAIWSASTENEGRILDDEIELGDGDVRSGEENDGLGDELSEGVVGSSLADETADQESSDGDLGAEEESGAEDKLGDIFVPDKHGLNDGFFSIDEFNKQSGLLEQLDARGDEIAASDEDEIDWAADPMAMVPSRSAHKPLGKEHEGQESSDEEDGPTFGNADLNAPDTSNSGSDADDMQVDSMNNTNDIKYADFYAPPPREAPKSRRRRALPKTQPPGAFLGQPEVEDDIQRTISAVRRDIFEDEDDLDDQDFSGQVSGTDPSSPHPSKRSNHQTRQAKLAAEIRRLEAANVAKSDWTLAGEARAADRPINSLLEEDIDFERAGKPVPIITNEVSEDIEVMIKRRILAREFDEVIRRRPGNLAASSENIRRGRFELDDTKPQQSLAEIYEAEHLKAANPDTYKDANSEKLKHDTEAVELLWKEVSAKLDALCSLHYRPKPPQASISVVADVPAIIIEDARPSAGGHVGGASMLAPQEIYVAGEDRGKEEKRREVVLKGGAAVAREEMEQDEKKRRRRRHKERIRKIGDKSAKLGGKSSDGKKNNGERQKQEILGTLKKGGVRVIGKKGEIRDTEGKKVDQKAGREVKGAARLKL